MVDFQDSDPKIILAQNREVASNFQLNRVYGQAARNWDIFYKHNASNFFKERHWTDAELVSHHISPSEPATALEVGCGTGSFVYPLLELYPQLSFHACDFSKNAIEQVRSHAAYDPSRIHAFVHDLTKADLSSALTKNNNLAPAVDMASCIFVLSAIPPEIQPTALADIVSCIKPGGVFIFRDYALHDVAQLRFHTRASANYSDPSLLDSTKPFYRRSDQTMTYFFTVEELTGMLEALGMETIKCEVILRKTENRKSGLELHRRFVQGTWRKPV